MIQNTSAVVILALFWIFLYVLKEYIKDNFSTKNNEKIIRHADLILIFPGFISLIMFAVLLIQDTPVLQNQIMLVWIEMAILLFSPFIIIFVIAFIKSFLESIMKKKEKTEHD